MGRFVSWLWTRTFPLVAYALVAVVMYLLVWLALSGFAGWPLGPGGGGGGSHGPFIETPRFLAGWARFDSGWYESIAHRGYFFQGKTAQSSVAFFPLYPLLTRWLSQAFGGDTSVWGVLITLLSGFGAAMLFWRWVSARLEPAAARAAFAVLAVWPFALYLYGAVYADALFVFLVLAAFSCLESDRVAVAALFGALATATRPVGIAVVIGLVARMLERRGVVRWAFLDRWRWLGPQGGRAGAPPDLREPKSDQGRTIVMQRRRLRPADPTIVLSVSGLVVYAIYLRQKFGDPFAFATAEAAPGWDQNPGPRIWFKAPWFRQLLRLPEHADYFALATLQGALAIFLLALVPKILKRYGWAYGLYTVAILGLPLAGSKDFQGLGRYALAAFPAFAILGEELAHRRHARLFWFSTSFVALCALSVMYARGRYIA
jgi:hypothetical protein